MSTKAFVKLSKIILILIWCTFLTIGSALAATDKNPSPPTTAPDPNANPMLAQYIKDGIQLYYLGRRSGLDGWFLLKDGQIQIAYTTADNQSILIGAIFSVDGEDVTENQIRVLNAAHPEIKASMQENIARMQQNNLAFGASTASERNFFTPQKPGEKLIQELQVASGVDIGDHKAPQIYMIMDPNCPHCQATWKALRGAVFKNSLQVHLIPIGRNDEDERAAAQLLTAGDPLNAWDKYVAGDKTQLSGEADPMTLSAVKANHTLIDRWNITETPYLVYRGKDGKIKILIGEPQKPEAMLADIGS